MRALVISNHYDADTGLVGARFRHHGFQFTECHRERSSEWPDVAACDLVLSLGSDWSVYWPHIATEVAAEAELIRRAHGLGVPIFGICYGNQIMAHALGGTVESAGESEIGWYEIVSDLPEAIATGPWFQWHSDVVTLPGAATQLARSAVGPQAWRLGKSFCTQFHPEVTESIVGRWIDTGGAAEAVSHGHDPQELLAITRMNVSVSRPNTDRLVDWYVEAFVKS